MAGQWSSDNQCTEEHAGTDRQALTYAHLCSQVRLGQDVTLMGEILFQKAFRAGGGVSQIHTTASG